MEVSVFGALIGGLLSVLSPCVLPLVPPYLCYLGGITLEELAGEQGLQRNAYIRVVAASIFFVLGFTTVFVALGATATAIGQLVSANLSILSTVAGVVIILFGLHFLGMVRIPLLYREARLHSETKPASFLGAYIMGFAFAFGSTPCVGPVFATILFVAGAEDTIARGIWLLFVYSLGLGLPFIGAALAIRPFMSFMQRYRRHMGVMEKTMGGLLVITGILFMTGSMNVIAFWLLEMFPGLGTIG